VIAERRQKLLFAVKGGGFVIGNAVI
jgi:hypothetical protein